MIGVGLIKFGTFLEKSLEDLGVPAILEARDGAGEPEPGRWKQPKLG